MHRHVLSVLRRSPVLAALAGVLVLASAGFAVASALPGTGSTIHACIQKNGGALRVVGAAKDCKKSERAISFAKEGPRGLTGQTGAQGPAGANGKDGAQGPQGPQGPRGPAGQDAPKVAPPHQAVIGTATLTPTTGTPQVFDILGLDFEGNSTCTTTAGMPSCTFAYSQLQIVKRIDATSPVLFGMEAAGRHASVRVDLKPGSGGATYRSYTFSSALLSSIKQDAPDAGGKTTETLTIPFPSLTITSPGSSVPATTDAPVGRSRSRQAPRRATPRSRRSRSTARRSRSTRRSRPVAPVAARARRPSATSRCARRSTGHRPPCGRACRAARPGPRRGSTCSSRAPPRAAHLRPHERARDLGRRVRERRDGADSAAAVVHAARAPGRGDRRREQLVLGRRRQRELLIGR